MKIFNVIAILCSLFIVVNGQTAQEYTFTLNKFPTSHSDLKVLFAGGQHSMTCVPTHYPDCDECDECTAVVSTLSGLELQSYVYSYLPHGDPHIGTRNEYVDISGKHPCIVTIEAGSDTYTTRLLQNDVYEYTDVFRKRPPCNVGNVQCGEFVYAEHEHDPKNILPGNGFCQSILVNDISTLKDKLALSNEFNGNCEMST